MKIDKYELTKNNNYNVYLSNGEVLTLDERVITSNSLLLKKEIDSSLYDKLKIDNDIISLYNMAIKYINVRLRSEKEVRDYLAKKCDNSDYINVVVDRLILYKYLDDDRFSKAFIKDKINFTMMGDYKIKKELERFGIDNDIINNNINDIDSEVITSRIKKIIDKDIRCNKKYSDINLKNKIFNHLISQGYSKDIVISVINSYDFQYNFSNICKNINGDDNFMKKIISIFIFLILLVGCSLSNSPTSLVEELLSKYQRFDSDIESGISNVLDDENLTSTQKERYKKLLENQYRNLSYEIKDERIDGEEATISTEIKVINYKKAINDTYNYYQGKNDYTLEEYNDTKLDNLEKEKEKVTYTIDFDVKKDKDGNWKISSLSNETIKKIQGMY